MSELKWKCGRKFGRWEDQSHKYVITRMSDGFMLEFDNFTSRATFKKLKNAKLVAELIENG